MRPRTEAQLKALDRGRITGARQRFRCAHALVEVRMTLPERTVLAAIGVCFVGLAIQVISA